MSRLDPPGALVTREQDREPFLWIGRTVFDVILTGDQTAGAVALLDQRGHRGDTTPLHLHRDEAEIFYVIEGGIRAWAGEDVHDLEVGAAVYLPPGQPHAFAIRTESARLITVTAPAGFADFVSAAGIPVPGDLPVSWEFDVGRLMSEAPKHGIEILGPPPALD